MRSRIVAIVLGVGLLFSALLLASRAGRFRLPGNQQGYEPVQPIAYSHRLHAGELQIDCLYCHSGAETSRHAGIPAENVCMNCHKFVTATIGAVRAEDAAASREKRAPRQIVSAELQKLIASVRERRPVEWTKVHNLPDFVYFDHRAHVGAGVACQTVPWAGRNHGARAAGEHVEHGLVRELPPHGDEDGGVNGLRHMPLLSGGRGRGPGAGE